jgi:hypothetical protein
MSFLNISGRVRRELGEANAAALDAGVGVPADAQCWRCGGAVNIVGSRPGQVSLCILAFDTKDGRGSVSITLWAHRDCSPSRVVPYEEFEASPAANVPSPVVDEGEKVIVDGEQII